jgi:L-arabinose transport system substrate-binding protein
MHKAHLKRSIFYLITLLVLSTLLPESCSFATSDVPKATSALPDTLPAISTHTPLVPIDAPTTAQPGGRPLYVVINPPGDEFIDLQNSFIRTANSLGADVKKFDDPYDTNSSITQVNDAIKAGARGIAIQAFAPLIIGPTIAAAARAAGVMLIAIEAPMQDTNGKPVPIIRFDDEEMGRKVGEAASKLLADSGWLKDSTRKVGVLSLEVKSQPFCVTRTDNEKAAIKAAGIPDKQIFTLQYDIIMIDSQDTTGAILDAHPEITNWVVFGCTDSGVSGSLKALAAAGVKAEDIIGIGIGASEACIPWATGQPTGFKASLVISSQDIGRMAATVLNDAVVNGRIPPDVTLVPTTIVDATNFKTFMDPVLLANCSK